MFIRIPVAAFKSSSFELRYRQSVGGGEGIRTPDPRVANAVLCQLSYAPDKAEVRGQRSEVRKNLPASSLKSLASVRLVAGAGFEPATFGL